MNKQQKIIDQMEKMRTDNNKNWMDMLRLAFDKAPEEAAAIMERITECDRKISALTMGLGK